MPPCCGWCAKEDVADEATEDRGRRREMEELRDAERRYRTVIEQSPLSIHVFSPDGRSLLANASWNELWNLEGEEAPEGTSIFEDEQLHATGLMPYIQRGIAGETVAPEPLLYEPGRTGREGETRWLQAFVYPVKDEEGRVREVTLIIEDVTERKRLEERLEHQAFYDDLTGLPNRALFVERLDRALGGAEHRGDGLAGKVAVLFMDLDNFKYVNDSLGHAAGDGLLCAVAERLGEVLGPEDTLARLGGDEFLVLIEDVGSSNDAFDVAERLTSGLVGSPFALAGREVFVTASVGVVLGGPDEPGGTVSEDLLRNADLTMYRAKEGGKDRCEVFDAGTSARPLERLGLEGDLRQAVERGGEEFEVHYQPEVELRTGRIIGFEALVRWRQPGRGLVSPAGFIPLAEETGLILPIGRLVLLEACRRAQEWRSTNPDGAAVGVSVNLSARQFQDAGLVEDVARVLGETGLEPGALTLELTEGILTEDTPVALATVQYLKLLGVGLAIDDFGTGYSSLSYLKRFPVDYLKIDRSIVNGVGEDRRDEAIVSAAITLARALGERVVAEGIETEGQLTRLQEMGCDLGQGYLFSRPLPLEEASALLQKNGPPR